MNRGLERQDLPSAKDAINFLRVSPQLHVIVASAGLLAKRSGDYVIDRVHDGEYIRACVGGALGLAAVAIVGFEELKAAYNLRRYNRLKRMFEHAGWDQRIANIMQSTWCDMYATRVAAIDTGHKAEVKEYYRQAGVSWLAF